MKLSIVVWHPYTANLIKSVPWGLGHADLVSTYRMFVGPHIYPNLQGTTIDKMAVELRALGFSEVEDGWISVEQELPPADTMVWGCLETGPAYCRERVQTTVMRSWHGWSAVGISGRFYSIGEPGDKVTHWRSLPDFPEDNHEA
jgi:hypothetical protein